MNSIKCPSCGLVNFADADSCKRCGSDLAAPAAGAAAADALPAFAPGTTTADPGALRVCAGCRMPYDKSAWRCPHCGQMLGSDKLGLGPRVALFLIPLFILLVLLVAWRY